MNAVRIILIIFAVIILGTVILPLFNRWQFKRLPYEQQVLAIMKQAKGLVFWKNISNGRTGNLFYVKNKRKILVFPWEIDENGIMIILKENPFDKWDYPQEMPALTADEIKQAREELYKYSNKFAVKILFNDPFKNDKADSEPNQ
ncbi:MAG: hypothetical protein LUG21_01995 [Clostridiales bacterium]|nr:hypothetical protein [Clostridiales bacterium]